MTRTKSSLKRSTVILDDNMVREYKLALEKLTLENTKQTHTPKQMNSSDSASSISSMLSRDNSIMDLLLIEDEHEFIDGEETSEVVFLSKGQLQLDFQWDLWENDTGVLSRTPLEF